MKFIPFALALIPLVAAQYLNRTSTSVQVVTETSETVVSVFTTYCPLPTTIVTNNKTYVVSTPTTLTITNCPCTIPVTTTKTATVTTPSTTATQYISKQTVVTEFTTYCPYPTTIITNGKTYVASSATTLTITIPTVVSIISQSTTPAHLVSSSAVPPKPSAQTVTAQTVTAQTVTAQTVTAQTGTSRIGTSQIVTSQIVTSQIGTSQIPAAPKTSSAATIPAVSPQTGGAMILNFRDSSGLAGLLAMVVALT